MRDESQDAFDADAPDGVARSVSQLDELAEVRDRLLSTRTADGFLGIDRKDGSEVLVWILRHSVKSGSNTAKQFIERLSAVEKLDARIPRFRAYGVDDTSKAFLVMDYAGGSTLVKSQGNIEARQELFSRAVEAVSVLHNAGLVVGDIGEDSFLISPSGELQLVGFFGSFDIKAQGTSMLPPRHTMPFLSPEQRTGAALEPASDIYALGVLAYRFFSDRYPQGDKRGLAAGEDLTAHAPSPSSLNMELPIWLDDVIGNCLNPHAGTRFTDASALLSAMQSAEESGVAPVAASSWSNRTVMVRPATVGVVRESAKKTDDSSKPSIRAKPGEAAIDKPKSGPSKAAVVIALGAVLGVVVGGMVFLYVESYVGESDAITQLVEFNLEHAPPELKAPMDLLIADDIPLSKKRLALGEIAASDDPVATAILMTVAQEVSSSQLQRASLELLVDRISRHGLERSAKVVERWFKKYENLEQDPTASPAYKLFMRACNRLLPLQTRQQALEESKLLEPVVALRLAASLSLDEEGTNDFKPVLDKFVAEEFGMGEDLSNKSVAAILLGHPALSMHFDESFVGSIEKLSDSELAWILLRISKSESGFLFDVAEELISRNVVPPFQAVFLKALLTADRYTMSKEVKLALARGVRGETEQNDVAIFGRWLSRESVSVLLAVVAIADRQHTSVSAFDTVVARQTGNDLTQELISWVKRRLWAYRKNLAKPVAIIHHVEIASDEQLSFALDALVPYARGGELLKILLKADDERIVLSTIERLGEVTEVEDLLSLLNHESKKVRTQAIYALKGHNELNVLQSILRAHAKEKDEEILDIYCKVHWVTCDRE